MSLNILTAPPPQTHLPMPSSPTSDSLSSADKEATAGLARDRLHTEPYRPEVDTSSVDEKKLLRKLDWALVPWLSFLYLLSFLDRTSIGNARVSFRFRFPDLCVISLQCPFSRQSLPI